MDQPGHRKTSAQWGVLLLHAAAWIVLFSLPWLLRPHYEAGKQSHPEADEAVLTLFTYLNDGLLIVLFYLNARVLVPGLIDRRLYGRYILIQLALLPGLYFIHWFFLHTWATHTTFMLGPSIFFTLFPWLFILASSTAYQMILDSNRRAKLDKEREHENLRTELSFLRSQVSPHFMFNVLNNMVSLARKNSDLLEPSLIKLSSLMRYMLYEADEQKVPLEKETEYLQSYIDLQRQRFGSKIAIEVALDCHENRYEIEPMLLIPFVENAFKHGNIPSGEGAIRIDLHIEGDRLHFSVRNKFDPRLADTKDKDPGIGLPNVKRRLNLLYGDDHELRVTADDEWFLVSLQLRLH